MCLSGCLGIPRTGHSNVADIYHKSQGTASHGNTAGFSFFVRTFRDIHVDTHALAFEY